MAIKVGDVVMLVHPMYPRNQGRIGTVVDSITMVAYKPVTDHWLVHYPEPIFTTDGMSPYACNAGWRMVVIAPGEKIDDEVTEQPLAEVA